MLRCDKMITDYEWKLFQTKKKHWGIKKLWRIKHESGSNERRIHVYADGLFFPNGILV